MANEKGDAGSQKSFKVASNLSNLEDSMGVIGSSLRHVQPIINPIEKRMNKFATKTNSKNGITTQESS